MQSESQPIIIEDDGPIVVEEQPQKDPSEMTPEEKQAAGLELTLSEKRAIAGRKGGKNGTGLVYSERRIAYNRYREKVVGVTDILFRESLHNARGHSYLYKIEKEPVYNKDGEITSYKPLRPKKVKSEQEIEEYLAGLIDSGDAEDDSDPNTAYYYITTEKGDQRAIDSMLDRAYGKATQVVQTEDEEGNRHAIQGNSITFVKNGD